MLRFFLSSHGHLASGYKSAAELLLGELKDLSVFDAYVDESSPQQALELFFETVQPDDTVILLADLVGGSVANAMAPYSVRSNTYVIGGINLALLLELVMLDHVTQEEIHALIDIGKGTMKRIVLDLDTPLNDDNEDFY